MSSPEFVQEHAGLGLANRAIKRGFDIAITVPALLAFLPLIGLAVLAATIDTREWGVFSQIRIGRNGKPFRVHKIRTMRSSTEVGSTVTTASDPRITGLGRLFRRTKVDELPQLWDVLVGNMSLVGPRPDVPGWADQLEGADRVILSLRPGITGPASLAFRNEESLLNLTADPERYNREVIWPTKVGINREYCENWSPLKDVALIVRTVFK